MNTVYDDKIIEAKATELLQSAINTRNLMTVDNTLADEAGMTKTINVYTYDGEAEALKNGVGSTPSKRGSVNYVPHDYTVQMVQQAFDYTDEDFMKDNTVVDNMVKGANAVMVNKMNSDFIAECKKASTNHQFSGSISYDAIVDAISKLNIEDESKLFVVIPNVWKAALRKDPDYKAARMGEVIYNGQVGTIAGLPVIATKAVTDAAFVMDAEAVKLFIKSDVTAEQDRDKDKRVNSVYLRTAYLVALVDNAHICKMSAAA